MPVSSVFPFSRGQMALDLVLAMLVLLIVLNGFSSVYSQFQKTHAEISVREQLRENAWISAFFISQSVDDFLAELTYPPTAPPSVHGGNQLSLLSNQFYHYSGSVPLIRVRGLNHPQGLDCNAFLDFDDTNQIILQVKKAQAGTDFDVNGTARFGYRNDYLLYNSIDFQSCLSPIQIWGHP